jgi:hypothetical protein
MVRLTGEKRYDAASITVEMSADGESGRLIIFTNRDLCLVVAANLTALLELRRQLKALSA